MPTGIRARVQKTIEMGEESADEIIEAIEAEGPQPPEPVMEERYVREDGEWVKKLVPKVDYVLEDLDLAENSGDLSPTWYEGRGREMEAKWLYMDTKYHDAQIKDGWSKVNPKHYQDPRYPVRDIPGRGKVITFHDCFLCEMPKDRAEALREHKAKIQRREQLARMYGIGMGTMDPNVVSSQFGDHASLINALSQNDGFRQGVEAQTLQGLPYDSPMAKEARTIVESLNRHRAEANAMNKLRLLENN